MPLDLKLAKELPIISNKHAVVDWRTLNDPEGFRTCTWCGELLTLSSFSESFLQSQRRICKSCWNEYSKDRGRKLRLTTLQYLTGGPIECRSCGFNDERALQIDHIHGGGKREHDVMQNKVLYRKILDMSLEEARATYQVLCANCNQIKKRVNVEY